MKPKFASLLLVLCLATAAYAETIVQRRSTPLGGAATIELLKKPTNGNFMRAYKSGPLLQPDTALSPTGLGQPWFRYPTYWVTMGPYSPNAQGKYIVTGAGGAVVNFTVEEVKP